MSDTEKSKTRRVFVVGGVKSGKSSFAMQTATSLTSGSGIVQFIATADSSNSDESMLQRIERHQSERPDNWITIEEPIDIGSAIHRADSGSVVIVDCLTVWLSNLVAACGADEAPDFRDEVEKAVSPRLRELASSIATSQNHLVIVSNDVGTGVAPATRLGNVFADWQGIVNQQVAAVSDEVYLMTAGIPLRIK